MCDSSRSSHTFLTNCPSDQPHNLWVHSLYDCISMHDSWSNFDEELPHTSIWHIKQVPHLYERTAHLIDSNCVGWKCHHYDTSLAWPFWSDEFLPFHGLRLLDKQLLRTPHAGLMLLWSRSTIFPPCLAIWLVDQFCKFQDDSRVKWTSTSTGVFII